MAGMSGDTASLVIHPPETETNGVYDLYFRTNLDTAPASSFSLQWRRILRADLRTEPGQTNLFVANLPPEQGFFRLGPTNWAIRPGFTNDFLDRNDDNHTGTGQSGDLLTNLLATIGFSINFYGSYQTNLYVNNNGNVTFDDRLDQFVPDPLGNLVEKIIAPFWADVDTRNTNSDVVRYGTDVVDGCNAFGVNWVNVGYYNTSANELLSCQLVIIDRSGDFAPGDFDMEFNYDKVEWDLGNASGNYYARAGYSDGSTNAYELPGSGMAGAFLDSNLETGLIYHSLNSPVSGRYLFRFRNGEPLPPLP